MAPDPLPSRVNLSHFDDWFPIFYAKMKNWAERMHPKPCTCLLNPYGRMHPWMQIAAFTRGEK